MITQDAGKTTDNLIITKDISNRKVLTNIKILFANISVFFAVFQFTFIDPVQANYLNSIFGINYEDSGYYFSACYRVYNKLHLGPIV